MYQGRVALFARMVHIFTMGNANICVQWEHMLILMFVRHATYHFVCHVTVLPTAPFVTKVWELLLAMVHV